MELSKSPHRAQKDKKNPVSHPLPTPQLLHHNTPRHTTTHHNTHTHNTHRFLFKIALRWPTGKRLGVPTESEQGQGSHKCPRGCRRSFFVVWRWRERHPSCTRKKEEEERKRVLEEAVENHEAKMKELSEKIRKRRAALAAHDQCTHVNGAVVLCCHAGWATSCSALGTFQIYQRGLVGGLEWSLRLTGQQVIRQRRPQTLRTTCRICESCALINPLQNVATR